MLQIFECLVSEIETSGAALKSVPWALGEGCPENSLIENGNDNASG